MFYNFQWATDIDFSTPTGKQVELAADYAPHYVYQFSYWGKMGANYKPESMLEGMIIYYCYQY